VKLQWGRGSTSFTNRGEKLIAERRRASCLSRICADCGFRRKPHSVLESPYYESSTGSHLEGGRKTTCFGGVQEPILIYQRAGDSSAQKGKQRLRPRKEKYHVGARGGGKEGRLTTDRVGGWWLCREGGVRESERGRQKDAPK